MPEIAVDCAEGCAASAALAAGVFVPAFADSTSALTMRPRGPEPWRTVISTPFCSAILRASGEAKMRPPDGGLAGEGETALVSVFAGGGCSAFFGSGCAGL